MQVFPIMKGSLSTPYIALGVAFALAVRLMRASQSLIDSGLIMLPTDSVSSSRFMVEVLFVAAELISFSLDTTALCGRCPFLLCKPV